MRSYALCLGLLIAACAAPSGSIPIASGPATAPLPGPDPISPPPTELPPPPAAPAPPAQAAAAGMPCPDGRCADGLSCVSYYGVAGPRGPRFSSCELPCPGGQCPAGKSCVTISDGPGAVCR